MMRVQPPATERAASAWAVVAGGVTALAMPPLPLGFCAPLGVALWVFALQSTAPAFRLGLWYGVAFATPALFWIGWVTVPGTVALILISAAEYGLLAVTYRRLVRRAGPGWALMAFPLLWVILEKLRASGSIGFPWINLAHTQLDYLWLYQFVELTGDYGLSFWVVVAGLLVFLGMTRRSAAWWVGCALWVLIPSAWGAWRVHHLPPPAGHLRVALLQGDIDTYRKWDEDYIDSSFAVYDSLSRHAAPLADLIVWPETAAPTYLQQVPERKAWVSNLAQELKTPILVGTLSYARSGEDYDLFNSAYEVFPDGRWEGPYSKQQLVPFGEMIPGAQWFPWLADIDLGQGNFKPGPGPVVFDSAVQAHAALICYESAFSPLCREQVLRGARFLVIITNDSWYGRTPGPAQHAAMASLRAAEFRVGVARSANGGISLWTDRTGRRHDATRLFTRDLIIGEVPLGSAPTVYTRYGSWFVWACALPAIVAVGLAWRPRKRI